MNNTRGFSLLEMAIVLLIIGLLLSGGLTVFTTQQQLRRVQETQAALAEAREALIGFAQTNRRLPCPAQADIPTGGANAGRENCSNPAGVLPWATLGVRETDAWGNRFTYRVTPAFTTPFGIAPPGPPQGDMTISDTVGPNPIALLVPAVIISHGRDGNGAYNTQGARLPTGTDVNELANQLTGPPPPTTGTNFIAGPQTQTFDDHVLWLSAPVLINRMVAAGLN